LKNYIKTDKQLHWLCQTIAKANRSFVPKKADDSHTNLYFDSLGNRITGRWIEAPKGKFLLTLNLANLQYEWLNSSYKTVAFFTTIGKHIQVVEKEIAGHLEEFGLKTEGFTDKLHFEIPDYFLTSEAIQAIGEPDLQEWKYYRNLANEACNLLLGYLQLEGEARIWPHHFDTGIYIITNEKMGIGFGLAMSDALIGSPYFYMSGYPASRTLEYKNLSDLSLGRWKTGKGWQGAVLPFSELSKIPKKEHQNAINIFLKEAADWFLEK